MVMHVTVDAGDGGDGGDAGDAGDGEDAHQRRYAKTTSARS